MSRYVDVTSFCENICRCNNRYCNKQSCPILNAPAADVQEVKHGEWKSFHSEDTLYNSYYCSACGHERDIGMVVSPTTEFKYCPNCGAKMDGGNNNA